MDTLQGKPGFIKRIFGRDNQHWDGVPKINIYLLRLMFILMIVFLGKDSWGRLLTFKGEWNFAEAMAWCLWASFSVMAILGIINPLKMLPVVMLEILYKALWLIVVYPHWKADQITGSTANIWPNGFLWIPLPIIAMPWRYFWNNYILAFKKNKP